MGVEEKVTDEIDTCISAHMCYNCNYKISTLNSKNSSPYPIEHAQSNLFTSSHTFKPWSKRFPTQHFVVMHEYYSLCARKTRSKASLFGSIQWIVCQPIRSKDGIRSGFGSDRILAILPSGRIRILVRLSSKFSTGSSFGVPNRNFLQQLYIYSRLLCHFAQWLEALPLSQTSGNHTRHRSDLLVFEIRNAWPT